MGKKAISLRIAGGEGDGFRHPDPRQGGARSDQAGSLGTKEEPSRPAGMAAVSSPGVQQPLNLVRERGSLLGAGS
jgi:hypothetical protein